MLLHPAVLQALHMCNPLFLDFTLTYVRSPLGSTCIAALGTMSVTNPLLSSIIHLICGWSGPRARHDRLALPPSSTVMLLGTAVNTGESVGRVTMMQIKIFLELNNKTVSQVDASFKTRQSTGIT